MPIPLRLYTGRLLFSIRGRGCSQCDIEDAMLVGAHEGSLVGWFDDDDSSSSPQLFDVVVGSSSSVSLVLMNHNPFNITLVGGVR